MSEPVKPVDLDAIRARLEEPSPCDYERSLGDIPALCDEVEALRERVAALQAANEMLMADASKALVRALVHNDTARNPTKGD